MTYFNKLMRHAMTFALLAGLMSACGGGGGGNSSTSGATNKSGDTTSVAGPIASSNTMAVVVDSGVAGSGAVNQLFASITVCQPGNSSNCQTIDHLLVDTGSTGVRVFSAAIPSTLNLSGLTGSNGLPLVNCVQFIDNTYAWGPVVSADVVLGGKTAANVPIQIIASPAYSSPNTKCSSRGRATQITTAAALGANGILGLSLFKEDCGADCVTNPSNGAYFTCTTAVCANTAGSTASLANQIKHPVPLFASDNNGLLIDLPPVAATGTTQLNGVLIFGMDTQSNNQSTSASLLTADAFGYITTQFAGRSLTTSFIDSGSNGLFFDSTSLTSCSSVSIAYGFYCPNTTNDLSATLVGGNARTATVPFSVANAQTLLAALSQAVQPTLAGPIGDAQTFDWGLPFFYGHRVFFGIEGQTSSHGSGPFYAF
jgi:hypothetical protein